MKTKTPTLHFRGEDTLLEPSPPKRSKKLILNDCMLVDCIKGTTALSSASKDVYCASLRKISAIQNESDMSLDANPVVRFIQQPKQSIKLLEAAITSLASKQGLVTAILSIFKHAVCSAEFETSAKESWAAYNKKLNEQRDALMDKNLKSDRESAAWVDLKAARAKELELRQTSLGSPSHLLVAFYTLWPPCRGGDLGSVAIVKPDDARASDADTSTNVIVIGDDIFLKLRTHKTAKTYGTITRVLPEDLASTLRASLTDNPRSHLFESIAEKKPFVSEHAFTVWANRALSRTFGRPVTCNTLRHAFVSAMDVNKMSTETLRGVASSMGHSLKQQQSYRRVELISGGQNEIIFAN